MTPARFYEPPCEEYQENPWEPGECFCGHDRASHRLTTIEEAQAAAEAAISAYLEESR